MGDDYDPNAAVLELKLRINEEKDGCSYDVLRRCDDHHDVGSSESDCSGSDRSSDSEPATPRSRYGFFCECVKVFFLVAFLGVLAFVIFKWVGPFFMEKGWLQRYPKNASLIRLAGEGGWFDQFRAVALIRISPFPYILYNYCAVATSVKYGPYILGSILGMVPDVLVAIYT
ncbi:hypothetical protein Cgig2_002477 [Carnegiea gigantea]|uniref:VTT domain-containing protein n=1 Tax=Carnegiea gigantea TaxID=171969 RepID=A0A9Q1KT39_9CARY|nr:hypothetical protein Cgig2_002477 [Carnegiea gigantea]